jgi:hypothetical protein
VFKEREKAKDNRAQEAQDSRCYRSPILGAPILHPEDKKAEVERSKEGPCYLFTPCQYCLQLLQKSNMGYPYQLSR